MNEKTVYKKLYFCLKGSYHKFRGIFLTEKASMQKDIENVDNSNIDPFLEEDVEIITSKNAPKAIKKVLRPEDISFSIFIYKKLEKVWAKILLWKKKWVKSGINKCIRKYSLLFACNILLLLLIMPSFQNYFIPSVSDIPELQRTISSLKNQLEKQESSINLLDRENHTFKNTLAQKHESIEREIKNLQTKLLSPQSPSIKADTIQASSSENIPFIGTFLKPEMTENDFDTVWNTLLQKMSKGENIQTEATILTHILPKNYSKLKAQFDNLATFTQNETTSIEGLSKELVFFKGRLLNELDESDSWATRIWNTLKAMVTIDTAHKILIKDPKQKELIITYIDQAQTNLQNGKIVEAIIDIESINSSEIKDFKKNWILSAKRVIKISKIISEIQSVIAAEKNIKR